MTLTRPARAPRRAPTELTFTPDRALVESFAAEHLDRSRQILGGAGQWRGVDLDRVDGLRLFVARIVLGAGRGHGCEQGNHEGRGQGAGAQRKGRCVHGASGLEFRNVIM